jgi:NADH-quinone oxidoreductase chain G
MFNIRINNNICAVVNSELTLLQQCELSSIYIPRFCYHDRLSIAGNCRMCLIELETSVKPIIACSTSLVPNMSVYTNSKTVKKIRENILEFLLINHPLDCPICDQGGECDLQDQAMVFGSDRGRFVEIKRSVEDKNFGPFIKTVMTRCIHCTRCIRFFDEVAGISVLGMMGRGRDAEISTYSDLNINNELSGNVIDLCPVGALTSKPYAFTSRPWELVSYESIDIFDSLGSNLRIDVKGNMIMRVLPKLNDSINEEWITDQIRFSYDGFRRERLTFPLIKVIKNKNMLFSYTSWDIIFSKIKYMFESNTSFNFKIYSGELLDLFSLYLFRYWLDNCSCFINFFCEHYLNVNHTQSFLLSSSLLDFNTVDSILFYNLSLKTEISVLNARIKKLKWRLKDTYNIYYIGVNTSFNYKIKHLGLSFYTLTKILRGKSFICSSYLNSKLCTMHHISINNIMDSLRSYLSTCIFNSTSVSMSTIHYNLLGFKQKSNVRLISDVCVYYLLNYDKAILLDKTLINYVIYQGHHGNYNAMSAHIILPILSYTEIRSLYMNLEGQIQVSEQLIYGPGISKSCVEIFMNVIVKPYLLHALTIKYLTYLFNVSVPVKHHNAPLSLFVIPITLPVYQINVLFNSFSQISVNSILNNSLIYSKNKKIKLVF